MEVETIGNTYINRKSDGKLQPSDMNTSQRQNRNKDVRKFNVCIREDVQANIFLEEYQSFVFLNRMGLLLLYIDFSEYGRQDTTKQREFNNLRKQSFISIPENAFQVEINRSNKRKWKRISDSKPKTKKPKQSSQKPILHYQQERDSSPYQQAAAMECDRLDIDVQTNTEHLPVTRNLSLDQNSTHNYQDLPQQEDYNYDPSMMIERTNESGKSFFCEYHHELFDLDPEC